HVREVPNAGDRPSGVKDGESLLSRIVDGETAALHAPRPRDSLELAGPAAASPDPPHEPTVSLVQPHLRPAIDSDGETPVLQEHRARYPVQLVGLAVLARRSTDDQIGLRCEPPSADVDGIY